MSEVEQSTLHVFIPCDPPTATHQAKKIVNIRGYGKLADTEKLRSAREIWTALLKVHQPRRPYEGAIALTLEFRYPWLKSHSPRQRSAGQIPKITRPDCTNAAKTVEDVLAALRYFENDAQVAQLSVRKWHAEDAGLVVRIVPLSGGR